MSGSFSLAEKLAVAGAFCALVVLAVGTEDDPGVIVTEQSEASQAVSTRGAPDRQASSSSYWARSDDSEEASLTLPSPAVPEDPLPPGFGATPPPELQK